MSLKQILVSVITQFLMIIQLSLVTVGITCGPGISELTLLATKQPCARQHEVLACSYMLCCLYVGYMDISFYNGFNCSGIEPVCMIKAKRPLPVFKQPLVDPSTNFTFNRPLLTGHDFLAHRWAFYTGFTVFQ